MFTSLFCIFPLQDVSAKPELDLTDGLGLYSSLNGNNSLRMCAFIMITRCYIFIWKYSIIYFIVYYFRNISLRMCIHYDHQILHIYFNRSLPDIWAFICFFFQLEKLLNFCTASTSGALAQIHCFVVNQTLDELCIFCAQKYIVPLLLLLELEFLCVVMRQTEFARV